MEAGQLVAYGVGEELVLVARSERISSPFLQPSLDVAAQGLLERP